MSMHMTPLAAYDTPSDISYISSEIPACQTY